MPPRKFSLFPAGTRDRRSQRQHTKSIMKAGGITREYEISACIGMNYVTSSVHLSQAMGEPR